MNDNDWISLQEQLLSNIEKIENNIAKNNVTNDTEQQILFKNCISDVATSFHEQHKDVSLEDIKEISGFMLMLYARRKSLGDFIISNDNSMLVSCINLYFNLIAKPDIKYDFKVNDELTLKVGNINSHKELNLCAKTRNSINDYIEVLNDDGTFDDAIIDKRILDINECLKKQCQSNVFCDCPQSIMNVNDTANIKIICNDIYNISYIAQEAFYTFIYRVKKKKII